MKFRALLFAPILAFAFASPASAQAVVDNPGICAQLYPDANCENYGPGNPYVGTYSTRDLPGANVFMAAPVRHSFLKKHNVHIDWMN